MADRLFNHFKNLGLLADLHPVQTEKFRQACTRAVLDNPELGFDGLCKACEIYLDIFKLFPEATL